MTEDLFQLPLAKADQIIKNEVDHHRNKMQHWRRVRGTRIAAERAATGESVFDIASKLGVRPQMIYKLLKDVGQVEPALIHGGGEHGASATRHYVYDPDGKLITITDMTLGPDGDERPRPPLPA